MTDRDRARPDDDLLALYRHQRRIRRFEETVRDLRGSGDVVGSVHLAIGQEAIYVGGCAALADEDVVFATYRGHGWALACGVPMKAMFAELMGRATGVNAGRGGSAYFTSADHNFYGENSIVGAGAPIAVGAAMAGTHDGSGRVALTAFGDGAMNQGAVHEAMNFASAFDLPVIFVVENNLYSELTPIADMVGNDRLFRRASGYGMPGVRVDGNDVVKVRDTIAQAVARARSGEGPAMVECMTERLVGHYIGDAEHYRPPGEVDDAMTREPLVVARAALDAAGVTPGDIDEVDATVESEIERALAAAHEAPMADTAMVKEHLYA